MIRAVFIDVDNTLLDFDEYVRQTMRTGFEKFGLRAYEPWMYDVFTEINNGLWKEIEKGTLTFPELEKIRWNMVFEKLGISADGPVFERYFRASLNESAIPVDGAKEMLEELSRKYILCAASNGPYFQQMHRLELAGMDRCFRFFFISEKAGASKPSGEFFDYAFSELKKELGAETPVPAECLMLGDSMSSDMQGGFGYGMKTCFYDRNGSRKAVLSDKDGKKYPDVVILDLREAAGSISEAERRNL